MKELQDKLSAHRYMGHSGFENTAYYIHLLSEKPLSSARIDRERLNAMIPKVEDE